jgi:hypothetical protein
LPRLPWKFIHQIRKNPPENNRNGAFSGSSSPRISVNSVCLLQALGHPVDQGDKDKLAEYAKEQKENRETAEAHKKRVFWGVSTTFGAIGIASMVHGFLSGYF